MIFLPGYDIHNTLFYPQIHFSYHIFKLFVYAKLAQFLPCNVCPVDASYAELKLLTDSGII
jgi:hypothetical protein